MDPSIPIENLTTMTQTIRNHAFGNRFAFILAIAIAFFATLLTAVGLYGIFAHDVARRRREIGLRMALGATRVRLHRMFLRKAALITLTGGAIGCALSVFAGRLIQSMLYKFEGFDTGVFLVAAALLFMVMMLAVLIPVRRAVTTEPMESMRDE
jgi:ABC-type antimicrobial peptide transport system permease subunit